MILLEKIKEIELRYYLKNLAIHSVAKNVLGLNDKQKQISQMVKKIENFIFPPCALPLPDELIQEVVNYLNLSDAINFTRVNRHGQAHFSYTLLKHAQDFGYESSAHVEAIDYLKQLFKEVKKVAKQKWFPKKYFIRTQSGVINPEVNLQKFKILTPKKFIRVFKKPEIYINSFQIFCHFLLKSADQSFKSSKKTIDFDIFNCDRNTPLLSATRMGKKEAVQLFLKYGANTNTKSDASHRHSALHLAGYFKYFEIAELLIQGGANVHIRNGIGDTPLVFATKSNNEEFVQFLLEHGANLPTQSHTWNHSSALY